MQLSTGRDFFISYTAVNEPWAAWIAVEVERAGYSTVLQAFDARPGTDFVRMMQEATRGAARTIAVLSPAYFVSRFGEAEWRAAFTRDPTGEKGLLVPVRVQPCDPPGLLASRVYIDVVEVDEGTARDRLLRGVQTAGARPTAAPFPGAARAPDKRFPGRGPEVSNLPARNRNFSGRDDLLLRLHADLRADAAAAVLPVGAVHGLGGVGKTQLALEYAHRFRSDYDVIWWVPAELPMAAVPALAGLARRLGVPAGADQGETVAGLFDLLRGRARWLLIYDNAEQPDQLTELWPPGGGGGHVLVTSRWSTWSRHASSLGLAVMARRESVQFLRHRTGVEDEAGLDALAELVGDLPLALEEAAAYLEETRDSVGDYIGLVRERSRELFGLTDSAQDTPAGGVGGQRRVATVWSISLERVHVDAPAAEALLNLAAFLAPDIPRRLPTEQPEVLPSALASAVADRLMYNRTLASIGRFSLATVTPSTIGLHRLVQLVIQARLDETAEATWAASAVHLLRASFPNASWETITWATCETLLPHLLAVTAHAERLGVAEAEAGWLLDRASTYLRERGQYRQARPLAERAIAVTESGLGPDDVEVAWRRDELGSVLQDLGDLAGARTQYEQALQIGEAGLGPDHPDVGVWRGNLGGVLQDLGDLAGARTQLEQALQTGEAALGPDHPGVGIWRNGLGSVLQDLGDLAGARTQYERALQISEAALGPDHPTTGIVRNNLGSVLQALGDLAGARTQYEQALQISEAALGPDHPDVGLWRRNLGSVLQDLGDLAGARTQYEQALQISEAALGPDHPDVGLWRRNLGSVLQDLGDLAGARTQYERALQISEAALGPDHPTTGIVRDNLRRLGATAPE